MARLGIAALIALLIASLYIGVPALNRFAGEMPNTGVVAMWLGIIFSMIVGVGLMGSCFYSNRRGYDDRASVDRRK
ncbi:MAG TPA: hypothetical protein VJT13_16455 [Xanthobacteraceae bacterium]|nr:hypothetical protein [Xanthobacteraceae bacterium]